MQERQVTAGERYNGLLSERSAYEFRAQKCAALTVPYLFPAPGSTGPNQFPTPFSSEAARGVNSMASAITLALFPALVCYFRLEARPRLELQLRSLQAEFERQGMPDRPFNEVQAGLSMWERQSVKELERKNYRVGVHEAVRRLIISGNALAEHLDDGGLRVHGLRSYAVRRYPDDSLAELIIQEHKQKRQLTEEESDALKSKDWAWASTGDEEPIPIYTCVKYEGARYSMEQYLGDEQVEGTEREGPADDCPFWVLRWSRVAGEHYGRSFVEEHYGDIASQDVTQQALIEAAALSAKVLFMVDPASGVSPKALESAKNGAFRSGRADAVTTLQVGKAADMSVVFQVWERLSAQINRAFATPEVRNAERVTAEEIRFLQQQLERNLGGVFPLLALDLQLPMARQILTRLGRQGALPALPQGMVEPVIVTGVQALGRSLEAEKLNRLAASANASLGPQTAATYLDSSAFLGRLADAEGIDPQGLVRTEQQIAAMNQAAQQQEMEAKVAAGLIGAGGKVIAKAMPEGSLAAVA